MSRELFGHVNRDSGHFHCQRGSSGEMDTGGESLGLNAFANALDSAFTLLLKESHWAIVGFPGSSETKVEIAWCSLGCIVSTFIFHRGFFFYCAKSILHRTGEWSESSGSWVCKKVGA